MFIKAKQGTFLKKSTDSASTLNDNQKVVVAPDKIYEVEATIGGLVKGHQLLRLAYAAGDWYVFAEHWDFDYNVEKKIELITDKQATFIFGNGLSNAELADLNFCLDRFAINTKERIRHFMAQIAHESGGLKWLKELATGDDYEGRQDLGNTQSGDGRKYKGAGAIQLTGRYNYQAFANFMGNPKIMDGVNYVAANYPFTSAGFWWQNNRMNQLIDRGASVRDVTRVVNGGFNGLEDREFYYKKATSAIN